MEFVVYQQTDVFHSLTASWSEEHTDIQDDDNSSRCGNRGRTTYTEEQISALEKAFSCNPYPNSQARQLLAGIINVAEGKVKIWFQNRRARAKKQKVAPNSWPREGKMARRSKDHLLEYNADEKICDESCSTSGMKNCSSYNSSIASYAPMSLSDLTLNGSRVGKTVSTGSFNAVSFTMSTTNACESRDCTSRNSQNMIYPRFNKQWPNYSYNAYPSHFPIIKQSNFNFSSNCNQNSSNLQFTTSYENCVSGMSSSVSSLPPNRNPGPLWINRQVNPLQKFYSSSYNSVPSSTPFVMASDETPAHAPISSVVNTSDPQVPPGLLSPPPVRRFVFPFQTLSSPVEELKKSTKFVERKVTTGDKSKTRKNPYNQPSSNSNFESLASQKAGTVANFNLHGMDYRHQLSRRQSSREYDVNSSERTVQVNHQTFSAACQDQETTAVATCSEDRNGESGVPSSSSNSRAASIQWPCENIALANYFDTSTVQQSDRSSNPESFESDRYSDSNVTKSSSWKLPASASSASVVG